MVLATTSQAKFLSSLGITQSFNVVVPVPALTAPEQVASVLQAFRLPSSSTDIQTIARNCYLPIAIKPLLEVADVSQDNQTVVTPDRFAQCLSDSGFDVTSPSARAVGTSAAAASAYGARNRRHDDDDDDDM